MVMLFTAEIDMANRVIESDIADFFTNAAWAIYSTYHTVLKASPGSAIFWRDMLFDVPYIAYWKKSENTGNTKQIATQLVRTKHVLIGITQLVTKYYWGKMVFSAKQIANMKVIFGYHISSYEWRNQDSTWDKIRTIECYKSYTILWLIMYWHNYLCIPCSSQKNYTCHLN